MAKLLDCSTQKIFRSENYNYNFSKETGRFVRWGKDIKDDPVYSPYGMEIWDCEISSGYCSGKCIGLYKKNNIASNSKYMR